MSEFSLSVSDNCLPLLPRISLTMCKARREQSFSYLTHFLGYLKVASAMVETEAMARSKTYREDFTEYQVTDYQYALECVNACIGYLTNAQVEKAQSSIGVISPLALGAEPFDVTEDGKAQFIRPFALAPLFGVGWGPRQSFDQGRPLRFVAFENPMTRDVLEYWGPELRQEDLSVLLWLVKLNEGARPGARINFDGKSILKALGRSVHPNSLKTLFEVSIPALERAHIALFNAESGRRRSYRLVAKSELPFVLNDDGSRSYSLRHTKGWFELDNDYRTLLGLHDDLNQLFLIDMNVRTALASKPMALWLHMYLSSQFSSLTLRKEGVFTRDVETIFKNCYSGMRAEVDNPSAADMKEFRKQLKKAATEIVKSGGITDFHIRGKKARFTNQVQAA